MEWLRTYNHQGSIPLGSIPVTDYELLREEVCQRLAEPSCHLAGYFAVPVEGGLRFFCLLADDRARAVDISSFVYGYYEDRPLESITALRPEAHPFEREIGELYGIKFRDNPWDKPLRYPFDRVDRAASIDDHPFYTIDGEALHEVNVGPIHAGIIEPGAFRFICNGEKVLHLEIALGYQHRGIERLITGTGNRLRQTVLAESIAGDTAVGHATAYVTVLEKLYADGAPAGDALAVERAIALELERVAMHIADTGALCMDIGYQLGQVASEALRTLVINTTLAWCGSRFGKGLIRPSGTHYPLTREIARTICRNMAEVGRRYREVREDLKSAPSLLARFEDCGTVSRDQLARIGAVGMAARAAGLPRDVRATHPYGPWVSRIPFEPALKTQGDVMARLMLRGTELFESVNHIQRMIGLLFPEEFGASTQTGRADENNDETALKETGIPAQNTPDAHPGIITGPAGEPAPHSAAEPAHKCVETSRPDYDRPLSPNSLSYSLVEGWRGEICHLAVTDPKGAIAAYKIKDPSVHNWLALALAVRGEGISDFPICNKSFNLSYCGHDL